MVTPADRQALDESCSAPSATSWLSSLGSKPGTVPWNIRW